jgi:hypothetical protein
VKITIDKSIPDMTAEEIAEITDADIPAVEDNPDEFKRQMAEVQEVVITDQVRRQLEEAGISPDELVAELLKQAGKTN